MSRDCFYRVRASKELTIFSVLEILRVVEFKSLKLVTLLIVGVLVLVGLAGLLKALSHNKPNVLSPHTSVTQASPQILPNNKVKYPQDFTFVLVGDSMTATLGNSDELRMYMKKYYYNKSFEFLNYGFGSTNILSVEQRLTQKTQYYREYRPILDIDFDLILIESFGNNPLSQYPLDEGLKIQTQTLDKIVSLIKNSNPRAVIVFVATIAPNSKKYGEGQVELSPEKRAEWAAERTAYIKNHIAYAQSHNIPLVNVYQKSLLNGDGNLEYLDKTNYIHRSPSGVYFISHEIADFIYQNKILDLVKKD